MTEHGTDVKGYGVLVYPVGPGILPPFRLQSPVSVQMYVREENIPQLAQIIGDQIDTIKKLI